MASPRKKLRISEFDDLASLEEETAAKVHGMITGLSPIKLSSRKPFFERTFSDGGHSLRFVGFNAKQQLVGGVFRGAYVEMFTYCLDIRGFKVLELMVIKVGLGLDIQHSSTLEFCPY